MPDNTEPQAYVTLVDASGAVEDWIRPGTDGIAGSSLDGFAGSSTIYLDAPDGAFDHAKSAGDTAGSGLGALLVSPTGHAHNSVTADEQILSAAGKLHTITIMNVSAGGTITVYDSLTETGTVIASIVLATNQDPFVSLHFDVNCATGLYIGYDGAVGADLTVSYSV